jgi:hypothetical protein
MTRYEINVLESILSEQISLDLTKLKCWLGLTKLVGSRFDTGPLPSPN